MIVRARSCARSTREESVRLVDDLVRLATNVAVADAQASGDERLATLADLE